MTSPRESYDLIGHGEAERLVAAAATSGRLPHAWLVSGPKGIGKATFGYRFARFILADVGATDLLSDPPQDLSVDPENPVSKRIAAAAHGDLMVVERTVDPKSSSAALRTRIVVDQIREVSKFFAHTSAEGGWRVAVIDGAEDMNASAANALLKILEEPPGRSLLILISHAAGRLLPTIRSRCRMLLCRPLPEHEVAEVLALRIPTSEIDDRLALAKLSEGSPGRAISLADAGGIDTYSELLKILSELPNIDYTKVHGLADKFQRREGLESFAMWMDLYRLWLTRMVRGGASGIEIDEAVAGERALQLRLLANTRLDRWVDLWEKTNELSAKAFSVNLDRKQVILRIFFELERAAQGA